MFVLILVQPPSSSALIKQMNDLSDLHPDKIVNILCHFTERTACFEETVKVVKQYVVYTHEPFPNNPRVFTVVDLPQPKKRNLALPSNRAGIYIVQAPDMKDAQKFVLENYVNENYRGPKKLKALLKPKEHYRLKSTHSLLKSERIYLGGALVYVPMGQPDFLNVFLRHDLRNCPEFLAPGCLHIFVNPRPDAIKELCDRVVLDKALQSSLFVCITKYDVKDLLYTAELFGSHWNPVASQVSYKQIFFGQPKVATDDYCVVGKSPDVSNAAEPDQRCALDVSLAVRSDPVRCTIRERTIVAKRETDLKFRIRESLLSNQEFKLRDGFPVEKEYELWLDDEFVCRSTVKLGEPVFVIPTLRTGRWATITMVDPTEESYLCCPKTGQFYFSKYLIVGPTRNFGLYPTNRYRLTINVGSTLTLKVLDPPNKRFKLNCDHRAEAIVSDVAGASHPLFGRQAPSGHEPGGTTSLEARGRAADVLQTNPVKDGAHFVDFGIANMVLTHQDPKESFAQLLFYEGQPHFFPKTIKLTEMYVDYPAPASGL